MNAIYQLIGISKQAHLKAVDRLQSHAERVPLYLGLMIQARDIHPGMGLREIYNTYRPEGIGRDAFIALGMQEGFRLRVLKDKTRTTFSVKSSRYTNLLAGKRFTDVNQIWSSDITYFKLGSSFYYIVLIMDVYSRRIVGYSVASDMRAIHNTKALKMALKLRGISHYGNQLIHHSDKGSQYIYDRYTELLDRYGIRISMCNNVFENTHIERANGTIKNYYLYRWNIQTENQLFAKVRKAIWAYNFDKPHQSLNGMTPVRFEQHLNELEPKKRPVLVIYTSEVKNTFDNPMQLSFNFKP